MKKLILKDEYDELERLINVSGSNWVSIVKYIKNITGITLLKECKDIVDKYRIGKEVDINLLSEFEVPEDDITILRIVAEREIIRLDKEWDKLRHQFNSIKTLFEVKFNSLLDDIQEQRNKIEERISGNADKD